MKKYTILLLLILFSQSNLFSAFTVTQIVTDEFPYVKVNFVATQPNGQKYDNLVVGDFAIKENGVNMAPTLELSCKESDAPAELSILLVLDRSGSMETNPDDGIRRWDWVVEGVKKFLETLKFEGKTKVAITAFSLDAKLISDFTNDKQMLIDTVEKIIPFGPTFYNPPFIESEVNAVKMLSSQPADMNRICIFLTDGLPEPGEKNRTEEIFKAMQNANIQVYTITLMMPMTVNLSRIAHETGGKSFEVRKKSELEDIYELIAVEAQSRQICELKWLSHYGCDEASRDRNVTIDFLRDLEPTPKDRFYRAPENSIAKLEPKGGGLVSFGNPDIGVPITSTATFTVVNGPFTYKGHTITPPTFFTLEQVRINGNIAQVNDVAQPNDTIEVDLKFTQQTAKEYRQALFSLDGVFCPGYVNLTGGFSRVVLVSPHTSVYSPCDGVDIQWAGVEAETPVNLYYSTDNGATWEDIVKNVSGGHYKWNPTFVSNNIKVKVEREARQFYRWVQQGKNQFNGIASGLDMDPAETYIYTTGYFQETLDFLGNTKISKGGTDIYVAKLDRDGFPQWVVNGGSDMNDSTAGIIVSPTNDIFIAGTSFNGLKFGISTPFFKHSNVSYGFISKLATDGSVQKTVTFGADQNANSQLWVRGIRYEKSANRIAVCGNYSGRVDFPSGISFQNTGSFVAYYDNNLNFMDAYRIGYNINDYKKYSHTDADGNIYSTQTFENTITFENQTFTSQDAKDFVVSCYGKVAASIDQSSGNFALQMPKISFSITKADVGNTLLGSIGTRVFSGLLKNTGNLPIVPQSSNMISEITNEFSLRSQLPTYMAPGEEVPLEFSFAPQKLGVRTATFTIISECGDPISLEIVGNGTCKGESVDLADVGKKTIGIRSRIVLNDIFTNPTSQVIRITPVIESDPSSEFEIFAIDQSGVEQATLNVPAFSSSTFVVYFTPKQEGIRTAKINFGVTTACENTYSNLQGEGINSSIVGNTPEIINRIRTVNNGKITLSNLSDLASKISNLQIVNDPNNYFKLVNANSSYDIGGNQSVEIDYSFTPLTEGVYSPILVFELASGKLDSTTILKGTGLFPELEITYLCADNATQSQTSGSTLRIKNKSTLTSVDVSSITSLVSDFKFDNGTLVSNNLNIAANSTKDVNVNFTPSTGGNITYNFDVVADAAIGYLIDDKFATDTTLPRVTGECEANPNTNQDGYDFANILVCDKPGSYFYTITNNSSSPLIINSSDVIITPNEGIFSVNMPATLTIPVGGQSQVEIVFTPSESKIYNASIQFKNNLNLDYTLNVTGTGIYIDLNATKNKQSVNPGEIDKLNFGVIIPKLTSQANNSQWDIQKVTINVKYNNLVVNIKDSSIVDKTGGKLTWTLNRVSFNEFNIVGVGALPTPYNQDLVSIEYYLNLSNDFKAEIDYNIFVENCNAGDSDPITVELSEFCARNLRVFDASGINSDIEGINPNPIAQNKLVSYSNAFNGPVKIEIRNSIGELISVPVNTNLESGFYQFLLEVDKLPTGVYFINYTNLQNTKTIKFNVNK